MKKVVNEKRDCSCKKTPIFENFNKSFYHDGYEDAYYLGYSDAKHYNNLKPIEDDEEDTILSLVYTIAIDNWGADYELVEDPKFINEVIRGYNDGIMDYREKDSNREYSRKDNENYRRHHGRGINENKQYNNTIKIYTEDIFDYLDNRNWNDLYDILVEFGYGDEYYSLVNEIMNYLGIYEYDEDYEVLYYGMGDIVKKYLIMNKMWK